MSITALLRHIRASRQASAAPLPRLLARVPGGPVLGAVFLVLALAGKQWLVFPLTAPAAADALFWGGLDISIGSQFRLALVAGVLCALLRWQRAALVLMAAAVVILLRVPVWVAAEQPQRVVEYVAQSRERQEVADFLRERYPQNLSPEPTFFAIDRIDGHLDQLGVGIAMLGGGWHLALMASLALGYLYAGAPAPPKGRAWGAAALALIAVPALAPPLLQLARAQDAWERGSRLLARGEGGPALTAFRDALARNPAFAAAPGFWVETASAFGQASGGRHPLGRFAHELALAQKRVDQRDAEAFAAAASRLGAAPAPVDATDALERGLADRIGRTADGYRIEEARLRLRANRPDLAIGALQRVRGRSTREAAFYLADAYLQQGGWRQAIDVLERLDERIAHPNLKADLHCTIGDAWTGAGELILARQAYTTCRKLDSLTNYRATRALGGT